MAEIVGLIATGLQFLDTVSKAREYSHDFRSAPKDQQQLLLEIKQLHPLLREVHNRIQSNSSGGRGLREFEAPLNQLNVMTVQLAKTLTPGGTVGKAASRLAWPLWGKKDVEEGLRTIERLKTLLNAWLGLDIS
jgi:hypothetical protein